MEHATGSREVQWDSTGKSQVESEIRKSVVILTKEVLVASWGRREWGLDFISPVT